MELMDIGWESMDSFGASGGILTLWDIRKITLMGNHNRAIFPLKEDILGRNCFGSQL